MSGSGQTLFTICLDYRGGTYLSQVRSNTVPDAIKKWAEVVPTDDLNIWNLQREDLSSLAKVEVVAVDDLSNVFCVSSTSVDDKLMLVHVIGTVG